MLAQWFELLLEEQLKVGRATRHMDHVDCEQLPEIVRAAPLVLMAQDLWGTTKKEIESRVRGRPLHRPTVTTSLLRE